MSAATDTDRQQGDAARTVTLLRRGLLTVAGLTIVGIALDLVMEEHWTKPSQLIAWAALVALAVAIGLLAGAAGAWRVRAARLIAAVVIASAALGVWEHVEGNHDSGPLDARYADTWDGLGPSAQWWLAIRKGVGPAPPLAPGALAIGGLIVLLASVGLPADVERRPRRR